MITTPDILFCAGNSGGSGIATNALITRTGTTNWWKTPVAPGGGGPGLIRPPIRLEYAKPSTILVTLVLENNQLGVNGYLNWWGTFDGSTNDPISYPQVTAASDLTLNLHLLRDTNRIGQASWQVPLVPGTSVNAQTSTNLVDWSYQATFWAGQSVEWYHHASDTRRFFRLVPNN